MSNDIVIYAPTIKYNLRNSRREDVPVIFAPIFTYSMFVSSEVPSLLLLPFPFCLENIL